MQTILIEETWQYKDLSKQLKYLESSYDSFVHSNVCFDFKNLKHIDSAGIILIIKYIKLFELRNQEVTYSNISADYLKMLHLYQNNYHHANIIEKRDELTFTQEIGKNVFEFIIGIKSFIYFLGRLSYHAAYLFSHPHKIRFNATIKQMEIAALQILPIIALALFLVGFVTAFQGADQLGKFGADILVIEMSTMSMFREITPFLAAIIVAGRSSSSFTAQIGTMNISEEISAMRTMNFDPDIFLLLPRIFALIIIMPLLVFFADMATLAGEMVIVKYHLGISYSQFLERIYEYVEVRHFLLGIFKAPLFGLIIGIIGCYRGLEIKRGSNMGTYTTKSVVDAIFWLIIVNALISLLSIYLGF